METKNWWQSKTMWAGIVVLFVGILGTAGIDASGESEAIVEKTMDIVTGIAGFIAIYGRITAKSKIGIIRKMKNGE